MICSQCETEGEEGALFCRQCLALAVAVDEPVALRGDEHILTLLEACEHLLTGRWDLASFRLFLADFAEAMAHREAGIRELEIPPYLEDDFAEEQEVGFGGVTHCNLALERLQALEEVDAHSVLAALGLFHDGVARVTEAMQINRRNRDRPLWA